MRIAIVGGGSAFGGALADHLHKAGHDIYWISEQKPSHTLNFSIMSAHYAFRADDPGVRHVLHSIQPDALVHLGAFDGELDFSEDRHGGERLLAGLTNLMGAYDLLGIGRFVLLSSDEVLGEGAPGEIGEEHLCLPTTPRGEHLASAEQALLVFGRNPKRSVAVARIASVYGPQLSMSGPLDYALEMIKSAHASGAIAASPNALRRPTFQSDAAEGVLRMLDARQLPSGVYQISGPAPTSDRDMAAYVAARFPGAAVGDAPGRAALNLSSEKLREACGYAPQVAPEAGLHRAYEWAANRKFPFEPGPAAPEQTSKPRRATVTLRSLLSVLKPYLENFALCAIAVLATRFFSTDLAAAGIDVFLLYVILIGTIFGKQQAAIAAILASVANITLQMGDRSAFVVMLDFRVFLHTIEFLSLGMLVGNARDQLTLADQNHEEEIAYQRAQYEELSLINEANMGIKRTLEERLLSYGDSFAKIYSIVSELDMMEPAKVLQASIDVVKRVMYTEDVAIYTVSERSDFTHLAGASSMAARAMGRAIRLSQFPPLHEAMQKQQVYVNRTLEQGYPLMAAPVVVGSHLLNIIMIWGLEFDRLTPYSMNLLAVIARLISSSADKANRYVLALRQDRYIAGTDVMTREAFSEAVATEEVARGNGTLDFVLFRVPAPAGDAHALLEFSLRVAELIRDSDSMGMLGEREMGLLLRNTSKNDAPFVLKRFAAANIAIEQVVDAA